jgi:outer membrane receptor protein involved in Fe transport
MRKLFFRMLVLLATNVITVTTNAQSIFGSVTNDKDEPLAATIMVNNEVFTADSLGHFNINVKAGANTVVFSMLNYPSISKKINANSGAQELTIVMVAKKREIEQITISGSRFKKRAAEEIVSIEVIKPSFIRGAGINKTEEALNKLPGVDVLENQINIRGGAGWSYGAGSRVMVLVDDMPMLTADAADAKWDFLPLENCEQIEVLKGAASALYGSSALNGAVNFRTAYAKQKPVTKLQLFNGQFGNPRQKDMAWWGKAQPGFFGGYASHAQKFGHTDVVLGSAWFSEDNYLQGDITRRIRFNSNIRHTHKKITGLVYGVNVNAQTGKSATFFLHAPDTSFANLLRPFGGLADSTTSLTKNNSTRFNIDPYVNYTTKSNWQHALRTRYLKVQNLVPEKNQTSTAQTTYAEYQLIKKWQNPKGLFNNLNMVSGVAFTHGNVVGDLYGNHDYYNIAPYLQLEKKIQKVWLAAGARYELNKLQGYAAEYKPVFRAGLNYEPQFGTNIRASWGQGYRYPTVAERFVKTSFGAASVFPNPNLNSETGWSAELGIKQAIVKGKWIGYIDAAAFIMRYKNMMEFNFGFDVPLDSITAQNIRSHTGFQSKNIGNTQIYGLDISAFMLYNGATWKHNIILGYTHMNPTQLNPDSTIMSNYSTYRNFLKYRYEHSIKASWDGAYGKFNVACINTLTSAMVNIDEVFENSKPTENIYGVIFEAGTQLPSTVLKFRNKYNTWVHVCDMRIGYQVTKQIKVALVVKNVFNTLYYQRPALINAPRNITAQLFVDL